MARTACYFISYDPADTYAFEINPSEEGTREVSRTLTTTARSDNGTGLLLQQGADSPMKIEISGTILTAAQDHAFAIWYQRSQNTTIVYQDFSGAQYQVVIERYAAPRQRRALNPRGAGTYMELATIQWTMTLHVLKVISGDWAGMVS